MTHLLKKPHVHRSFTINHASSTSYIWKKDVCHNNSNLFLKSCRPKKVCLRRCLTHPKFLRVVMATSKSHNVKAIVTLKHSVGGVIKNLVTGIVGKNHLVLELVSADLNPSKFMT